MGRYGHSCDESTTPPLEVAQASSRPSRPLCHPNCHRPRLLLAHCDGGCCPSERRPMKVASSMCRLSCGAPRCCSPQGGARGLRCMVAWVHILTECAFPSHTVIHSVMECAFPSPGTTLFHPTVSQEPRPPYLTARPSGSRPSGSRPPTAPLAEDAAAAAAAHCGGGFPAGERTLLSCFSGSFPCSVLFRTTTAYTFMVVATCLRPHHTLVYTTTVHTFKVAAGVGIFSCA